MWIQFNNGKKRVLINTENINSMHNYEKLYSDPKLTLFGVDIQYTGQENPETWLFDTEDDRTNFINTFPCQKTVVLNYK